MSNAVEEPEVLKATRSPHGYLASPLSDNISVREDGSLIIIGCPVARDGFQQYRISDLPQDRAEELGVDTSNQSANIDLYRPASEVFHPEFLASLNGIPIVDSHPANGVFVDKDNYKELALGHIQNPRKGTEPLESGDWPVIADLIISGEPLVSKVKNGYVREISLGYDFSVDRDGPRICQTNMLGNHCAIVQKGRAGDLVRIEDAAPEPEVVATSAVVPVELTVEAVAVMQSVLDASHEQRNTQVLDPSTAGPNAKEPIIAPVEGIETVTYDPITLPPIPTKEKHPVAETKKKDWLRLFKGKHLIEMARATDADPEEVMEAAEALNDDAEPPKNTQANEFKSEDKKGKDGEVPEALKEHEFKADDARKHLHDALDKALDKKSKAKDKKHAKDADLEELKSLLDEFLSEEEKEPEHAADEPDTAELDKLLGGEAEDCPECGAAMDECECPGESEVESGEEVLDAEEGESPDPDSDDDQEDVEPTDDKRRAKDRARAADGVTAVLKMLRPSIARTGDKAVQSAFNSALASVKRSSRPSTGSYGAFAGSARARDKAPRNPNPDRARAGDSGKADPMTKLQEMYNSAHKGGK